MNIAQPEELEAFLQQHPQTTMLEILSPDINGILRGKRIPVSECQTFFNEGIKAPASICLCNSLGDFAEDVELGILGGDPDHQMRPVANTLAPISWLQSDTAQILSSFVELDGTPTHFDPRNVLIRALEPFYAMDLSAIVATELEFYLIQDSDDAVPKLKLPSVPGTRLPQPGIQYAMPENLWEHDAFLDDVRRVSAEQNVPMTTVQSEFSPGQYEINLHHVADPVVACDHAVLLKRIVKGVARQHGMSACFMAKPFAGIAGSGLHIHFSAYDKAGNNVFADADSNATPTISDRLRHAIGGLAQTMEDAMAIFAPNANSYRRLIPGNYAPLTPNWGYNHRDVSLRIPVSNDSNRRVEHRVASADANPYLVMAAIAAGIHHGIVNACDPGEMIPEGFEIEEEVITLPRVWSLALDSFERSSVLPGYFGEDFCKLFSNVRRDECDEFSRQVSNVDYEWYLRSV
ncbi:MAG TPA: glutamine synthetase [Gammaproteobacteria bacterium]|nr:glutamine synthetase [Gammaproteobacteria bacterium]HAT26426.1 glutamine synthetase [Gammaproteobacteria bacterium]